MNTIKNNSKIGYKAKQDIIIISFWPTSTKPQAWKLD